MRNLIDICLAVLMLFPAGMLTSAQDLPKEQPSIASSANAAALNVEIRNGEVVITARGVAGADLFAAVAEKLGTVVALDGDFSTPVYVSVPGDDVDQAIYQMTRVCRAFPVFEAGIYRIYGPPIRSESSSDHDVGLVFSRSLRHANAREVVDSVTAVCQSVRASCNISQNAIVLSGAQTAIDQALRVIDSLDVSSPNVLVHVLMVELESSSDKTWDPAIVDFRSGLFGSDSSSPGVSIAPTGLPSVSVPYSTVQKLTSTSFLTQLHAVVSRGLCKIVSNPHVTTGSGKTAEIADVSEQSVVVSRRDSSDLVSASVVDVSAGVRLSITCTAAAGENIMLKVNGEVSGFVPAASTADFSIERDTFNTEVMVKEGETLIIGGLIHTTNEQLRRKVPLLGDIPIIKSLFRSSRNIESKTEMVVFLTPYVLPISPDIRLSITEFAERVSKEAGSHRNAGSK